MRAHNASRAHVTFESSRRERDTKKTTRFFLFFFDSFLGVKMSKKCVFWSKKQQRDRSIDKNIFTSFFSLFFGKRFFFFSTVFPRLFSSQLALCINTKIIDTVFLRERRTTLRRRRRRFQKEDAKRKTFDASSFSFDCAGHRNVERAWYIVKRSRFKTS